MSPAAELPETFREVERKLRVHGLYRLPDLVEECPVVAAVRSHDPIELEAQYHDTSDLRLARHGVTLRRRTGGSDEGWHLKLPADESEPGARDEVRLPLSTAGPEDAPPVELTGLVLGLTRGAPVEPVATLRTRREPSDLLDAEGRVLAELTDDAVSVVDGEHVAARFRELEVESRDGTAEEVGEVVRVLVDSGAVEGAFVSKAVRALGPAATAEPDLPEPGPVRPGDPAGDAVTAHLARHARAFQRQDLRVRRDLPDAVHQMRVAARRLRSGLKVFSPLVEESWSDPLRTELAWIAGVLGGTRDREVLEQRLLAHAKELPEERDAQAAAAVVQRVLDAERAQARTAVEEAMSSPRYTDLLNTLVDAAHQPRLTQAAEASCADALRPLVSRSWRRLQRDADRLDEKSPDPQWHQTRIAAKKARYATEALVPVYGAPAKALARQLERVTELLGEHQDAVIAADTARRFAGARGVGGRSGFALGLLHDVERAHADGIRDQFWKAWPEVSRKRHRTWLTS